jgi:DinB family protein
MAIATLASLRDEQLRRQLEPGRGPVQVRLYASLRSEQRLVVSAVTDGRVAEVPTILTQAQSAFRDLEALLMGHDDALLDSIKDGDWSLRDLLRHLIATELRYAEQVMYSAERGETDPIRIPEERLPCDRLAPPESEFGSTTSAGLSVILRLFETARARSDERLSRLSRDVLDRPSDWGSLRVDIRVRLHQIAVHIVEGTIQTEKMLGPAEQFMEARAIVRRIWRARGLHERSSPAAAVAELDAEIIALATKAVG